MAAQKDRSQILALFSRHDQLSVKDILGHFQNEVSRATLKRLLADWVAQGFLEAHGAGRSQTYRLTPKYTLLNPIHLETYFAREIDDRNSQSSFNFQLIEQIAALDSLFTSAETEDLKALHATFQQKFARLSSYQQQREMERLAIDLSWKSSQIEGNTYSLLETERLLKDRETAAGKTQEEANMLLNHKTAIDFVLNEPSYIWPLTVRAIEDVHSLLVKDLGVPRNIRQGTVGITGTNYKPLDNEHQLKEAMQRMCTLLNARGDVLERAFLALALLSYIQPFEDGNKRTARIISNALLLQAGYCPISYRTADSIHYKKAMLLFYEQNNISAVKAMFIDQYAFAVKTYF
jgi:hypothetical protein